MKLGELFKLQFEGKIDMKKMKIFFEPLTGSIHVAGNASRLHILGAVQS